jgi:hypothetical protein
MSRRGEVMCHSYSLTVLAPTHLASGDHPVVHGVLERQIFQIIIGLTVVAAHAVAC